MVEEEGAGDKSLLECLQEAPQWLSIFFSETSREYLSHTLGLVKSFLPSAKFALIGDGVAVGCSEEKFSEFVTEMKPVADKIISGLEPAPEAWTFCNILLAFVWMRVHWSAFDIQMYSTFLLGWRPIS